MKTNIQSELKQLDKQEEIWLRLKDAMLNGEDRGRPAFTLEAVHAELAEIKRKRNELSTE